MNHLFLIPYSTKQKDGSYKQQWSIVMGIKASRIIARRKGRYMYLADTPRVMNAEEIKLIMGEYADPQHYVYAITKLRSVNGDTAQGIGSYPKNVTPKGSDKGNSQLNMAMIRSERQALERLYPDSLPSEVEVTDEDYEEPVVREVDTVTGEIVEGEPEPDPEPVTEQADFGDIVDAEIAHPEPEQEPEEETLPEPEPEKQKDSVADKPVTNDQLQMLESLAKVKGLKSKDLTAEVKNRGWKLAKWADLTQGQLTDLQTWLNKQPSKNLQ
jgi:hypothetical protein